MPEALIWGASGGIGRALVQRLKVTGWRVFAAARKENRIPREADFTFHFNADAPHTIAAIPVMVAHDSEGLDLVVYAAGSLNAGMADSLTPEAWADVLNSNLMGAALAASASLPLLKPGGHMVFFGAYGDHLLLPKMSAYAAAKAGLEPLVKILQKENRKLKFTLVRPGAVATEFWQGAPFNLPKNAKPPEAVAEAVVRHYLSGESGELNL